MALNPIPDPIQDEITRHCIMNEPYKGYKSPYCGDGAVVFRGPLGDEVRGHDSSRCDWLAPAWRMAKAEIDRRTAALAEQNSH